MKGLLSILCVILMFSCKQESKIDYAVITGKIVSPKEEYLSISGNDLDTKITLKGDGTFTDTLNIDESGFYTLGHGRETTTVYISQGQNLKISLNTNQFDETLTFSGSGSEENNYLANKFLEEDNLRANSPKYYSKTEKEFVTMLDSISEARISALNQLNSSDEYFLESEKNNLKFDKFNKLKSYEQSHGYYANNPEYEASETFLPEEFINIEYDNEEFYKTSESYRQLAFNNVMDEIFDSIGDDYQNASVEDLKPITEIKINSLKERIVGYLGNFLVSPANPNIKEIYTFFKDNTGDEEIKNELTAKYNKVKDLTKGNPSPKFVKYENHKGGTMSLNDLKGKYVYIDVWATWCGPCIREIPSLKEVENEFKGKNIHFVSTSIDVSDKYDAWVDMVKDKDLGGIQLLADNAWQSDFVQDYAVDGIPRFILIDPEGNIVSADAPRPSNPKLKEMLEELNI